MTKSAFFKSKSNILLIIIPVLILILLTLGYFFVSNNSQNVNSTSSQLSNSKSEISKPEQLFSQNNQIQPLVADAEHDVVVLEECDLAVRFKKAFKIEKDNNRGDEYFYLTDGQNKGLFISCSGANIKGISNKTKFEDNDKFLTPSVKTLLNKNIDFSLSTNGVNSNECTGLAYNFQHNGKKYEIIDQIDPKPFTCAIDAFFRNRNNNFFTELFGSYGQDYIQIQFNSLVPSVPSVKLANSDSQETKAQNETATFKLADFSDDSLKKVTLNNILEDSNMKDCLNKTSVEPIFKKEVFYSKTLNKNYIKVNFGSLCTGNMDTNFGIIEVDSNGNASFLLKPNNTILQDMKLYLSPNSDKITLKETYKFLGCSANTNISVMDLKTKKYIYDSFTNSTSKDIPAKTEKEQTIIQEKFSKWLDNDNLEILAKAKTADFVSHSGCNEFQDKALQTKIIKI